VLEAPKHAPERRYGPKKRAPVIRGVRRSLTEDEQHKLADAVVEHLEPNNWKIDKGEPVGRHRPNLMKQSDNNVGDAAYTWFGAAGPSDGNVRWTPVGLHPI
jgi:hypothetical protein